MKTDVPGNFPERPDMPVISFKKGHLKQAVALLRGGEVDLNEPYAEPGAEAAGGDAEKKEESRYRSDNLIMERWRKLAGIL